MSRCRDERLTNDARARWIEQRSARGNAQTRALFGKKPAAEAESAPATKSRFKAKAKPAAAAKAVPGEPYYVDGKLWVCQGCGYVYDGSKGAWAEGKRCPACGERRFALKSPQELQTAIYALAASVALIGLLFIIRPIVMTRAVGWDDNTSRAAVASVGRSARHAINFL